MLQLRIRSKVYSSLMNQPPFLGKDRLSTLVTVFLPRQNSVLTNPIEEVQSGDVIGGSREQHNIVTRRVTRDFSTFLVSCI